MAYAKELTISTSNTVSIKDQSRDVGVSVTYQLERDDADVVAVVREKTQELAQAHRAAWQGLRDANVAAAKVTAASHSPNGSPPGHPASDDAPSSAGPAPERPSHLPLDPHTQPVAPLEPATPGQRGALHVLLGQVKWSEEKIAAHLREQFGCERIEELNGVQAAEWLLELQRDARVAAQEQHQHASRNGAARQ